MTISLNDKTTLKALRVDIEKALKDVAGKYGITFDLGNCRYDHDGSGCKFTNLTVTKNGAESADAKAYKSQCEYIDDLDPSDLGKSFTMAGTTYTIIGWKRRARTKQIMLAKEGDTTEGRFYKATVEQIVAKKKSGALS